MERDTTKLRISELRKCRDEITRRVDEIARQMEKDAEFDFYQDKWLLKSVTMMMRKTYFYLFITERADEEAFEHKYWSCELGECIDRLKMLIEQSELHLESFFWAITALGNEERAIKEKVGRIAEETLDLMFSEEEKNECRALRRIAGCYKRNKTNKENYGK